MPKTALMGSPLAVIGTVIPAQAHLAKLEQPSAVY